MPVIHLIGYQLPLYKLRSKVIYLEFHDINKQHPDNLLILDEFDNEKKDILK